MYEVENIRTSREPGRRGSRGKRPRLVVVEPQALLVEALSRSLSAAFDVIPVLLGRDSTVATVRDAVLRARPDAALVALELGPAVDTLLLDEMLAADGVRVVVLIEEEERPTAGTWNGSSSGGPLAIVSKHDGMDFLRRVLQFALAMSPEVSADSVRALRGVKDDSQLAAVERLSALTPRERDVLADMMLGWGADEIAHRHVVSLATVRTQIKSILAKLGVSSQLSAVAVACLAGWRPSAAAFPSASA